MEHLVNSFEGIFNEDLDGYISHGSCAGPAVFGGFSMHRCRIFSFFKDFCLDKKKLEGCFFTFPRNGTEYKTYKCLGKSEIFGHIMKDIVTLKFLNFIHYRKQNVFEFIE